MAISAEERHKLKNDMNLAVVVVDGVERRISDNPSVTKSGIHASKNCKLSGTFYPRIQAHEVTVNCSAGFSPKNQNFKLIHDNTVGWIAKCTTLGVQKDPKSFKLNFKENTIFS